MIERTETPAPASTPSKTWDVAIVGAGYVGVPLACTFATAGRSVLLVDVLPKVVDALNRGESHIEDVPSDLLAPLVADGRLAATSDYDALRGADAILIALPTPLSKQREPDLSIVLAATQEIAKRLREGQLVVLESTTYPGTTREKLLPILESTRAEGRRGLQPRVLAGARRSRLAVGTSKEVPKVVGGITEECSRRAAELYGTAIGTVHTVSSPEAAELTKLLENIFRSVNIALVNELAQLCDRMGIDVWEVVDAAATKPFGFMSFKPGPGLGGHCIPIDPFYLTWKAREFGFTTEFIELAGKVNEAMPYYCRSLDLAGAQPQEAEVDERLADPRARRRVQARHRRRARVAGAQADRAPAERRRERRVPRPARSLRSRARARVGAARSRAVRLRRRS